MLVLALVLGLITALANLLGSYLAAIHRHPSRVFITHATAFGGGFLLAAAILEMFPEALEEGGSAMSLFVAMGYLLVYFVEQGLSVHFHQVPPLHGDASQGESHNPSRVVDDLLPQKLPTLIPVATGLATLVAFNVHDFVDGLAIGSAMVQGQLLGLLVFLAVLLHEVPAGFVLASVMLGSGYSRKVAILAGVSIGLITLVGIAIPIIVGWLSIFATHALLALATGTFVYIGASILIPMVETGGSRISFLYVGLGFIAFFGSSELIGLFLGSA